MFALIGVLAATLVNTPPLDGGSGYYASTLRYEDQGASPPSTPEYLRWREAVQGSSHDFLVLSCMDFSSKDPTWVVSVKAASKDDALKKISFLSKRGSSKWFRFAPAGEIAPLSDVQAAHRLSIRCSFLRDVRALRSTLLIIHILSAQRRDIEPVRQEVFRDAQLYPSGIVGWERENENAYVPFFTRGNLFQAELKYDLARGLRANGFNTVLFCDRNCDDVFWRMEAQFSH